MGQRIDISISEIGKDDLSIIRFGGGYFTDRALLLLSPAIAGSLDVLLLRLVAKGTFYAFLHSQTEIEDLVNTLVK
ncbi:hypothetical protein CEXT_668231 [Caerostris extrusa]|uniref:Uncharacterized protein n=1 Tax=Caerostris extrusa TaxID=172846 RepID=A0AAV4QAP1_CAEEX|nr:hypothetical protein CEXT_668231 [Caerostris extrusa]